MGGRNGVERKGRRDGRDGMRRDTPLFLFQTDHWIHCQYDYDGINVAALLKMGSRYLPLFAHCLETITLLRTPSQKFLVTPLYLPSPPVLSSYSPTFPSLLFSFPLEVAFLNPAVPARGSGESCKLPQWGLGRSHSRQRFWCILRVNEHCLIVAFKMHGFKQQKTAFPYIL